MSYKEVRTEMESRLHQSVLHGYMTKTKIYACHGPLERGVNMERLTGKHYNASKGYYMECSGNCHKETCGCCEELDNIVDRLGQIEDILGEDYDLDRLRVMMNQQISLREEVHERFKLTGDIPLDRLRELVQAEREKRCFTSPVTVGQTVWFVRDPKRHPENIVETCVEKIIHKKTGAYMKLACNSMYETACSSIGKTVFLTREASTALKGETNK